MPLDHRGVAEGEGVEPSAAKPPWFSRPVAHHWTAPSMTGLPARSRTWQPAFGEPAGIRARGVVASTGGVEPPPSGFVDRRLVHSATSTLSVQRAAGGTRTRGLLLDGQALSLLSYGSSVFPQGLEPCHAGVRARCFVHFSLRNMGPRRRSRTATAEAPGLRPGSLAAWGCPWMRVAPGKTARASTRAPASRVLRCLCSCQGADLRAGGAAKQARKESNPRHAVLETAALPVARTSV